MWYSNKNGVDTVFVSDDDDVPELVDTVVVSDDYDVPEKIVRELVDEQSVNLIDTVKVKTYIK